MKLIWNGVADEAKRLKEIAKAHRTGKGEWYAIVEASRLKDPIEMEIVATAYEKCQDLDEAVAAGQRLLKEKADWVGQDTRVEVMVLSALEWQPDE